MPRLIAASLLLLPACRVVDAPETLEELVVFGFVHFDDDIEYLEAVGETLFPGVAGLDDELSEGYYVDLLTADDLATAGVDDPETEGIIGALGRSHYGHGVVPVVCGITWPDKDETQAYDNYISYEVEDDGNRDCFLAGECERYDHRATQIIDVPILGESTQVMDRSFRWVLPEDGEPWIASRLLSPTPLEFSTDILAVDQQYSFFALYPDGDTARRVEAFWVEARALGAEFPEAFAVDMAVNEMQNQADRVDLFLDGGEGCH
jgi:hypothetical protein